MQKDLVEIGEDSIVVNGTEYVPASKQIIEQTIANDWVSLHPDLTGWIVASIVIFLALAFLQVSYVIYRAHIRGGHWKCNLFKHEVDRASLSTTDDLGMIAGMKDVVFCKRCLSSLTSEK